MLRSILSTFAGASFAVFLVFVMEFLGGLLFPPQGFADPTDIGSMTNFVARQPLPAKLWLLLGYMVGATGGVFAAAFYSRPSRLAATLVTAFLLAGVSWNLQTIPHPLWLSIGSIAAILMGALTGFGLGQAKPANDATPKP